MINLEIETIQGVKEAFPKTYRGSAIGGYSFVITYDNYLLEMRVSKGGEDPRVGPIIISKQVPGAAQHDIADVRMVEEIERSGCSFVNRKRVIAAR